MAMGAVVAYPEHNKWFDIYTDAFNYQVSSCIVQECRPVAYLNRTLKDAQINYTTTDK